MFSLHLGVRWLDTRLSSTAAAGPAKLLPTEHTIKRVANNLNIVTAGREIKVYLLMR